MTCRAMSGLNCGFIIGYDLSSTSCVYMQPVCFSLTQMGNTTEEKICAKRCIKSLVHFLASFTVSKCSEFQRNLRFEGSNYLVCIEANQSF